MTIELVAALVALGILMVWPGNVQHLRQFHWYQRWLAALDFVEGGGRVTLGLVPPVVLCALIAYFLHGGLRILAGLAFAIVVLLYSFGPRELEPDFDAIRDADDAATRMAAAGRLRAAPEDAPRAFTAPELAEAVAVASLERRFGVLFWFFLLGPAGALGYRLAWVSTDSDDPRTRSAARRFARALDWIPAHLVVLAMAMVSNFEATIRAWRAWHAQPGRSLWDLDPGFLAEIARSGAGVGFEADSEPGPDMPDPGGAFAAARRLMQRVLVVWLAVVALIVIAGWIA